MKRTDLLAGVGLAFNIVERKLTDLNSGHWWSIHGVRRIGSEISHWLLMHDVDETELELHAIAIPKLHALSREPILHQGYVSGQWQYPTSCYGNCPDPKTSWSETGHVEQKTR